MVKPTSMPKMHARDNSASSPRNSLTAAIFGINKLSISIVVPQTDRTKPASSPVSIASTATQNSMPESKSSSLPFASIGVSGSVHRPKSSTPTVSSTVAIALSGVFTMNASKIKRDVVLPKVGGNVKTTPQLVACAALIERITAGTSALVSIGKNSDMDNLTPSQIKWMHEMDARPLEKEHIRQLMNQMVDRFIALPSKTTEGIHEIILLGPVLDKEHYRLLLNRFLGELNSDTVLNTNFLQGLVTLVECAPDFHLQADDLTKVLRAVRHHLRDSALQDTANIIQLTVAISKVLVIMADCGVKDLNHEHEHKPLLEILTRLKYHSDPLVRYQVEYAYRALQLVPDDETMRQKFTRNGFGLAGGLIKVGGAIKLDFGGVPEGLPAVWENGRELAENLKKYFGSGDENPWFLSVRLAEVMISEGRLLDFNQMICEDECRQDPFFQWGVCLILGEMAVEPLWDATTRDNAMRLLGDIFRSNPGSQNHRDVRRWILTLLYDISRLSVTDPPTDPDYDAIKHQVFGLLQELDGVGGERLFPLRYSHPAMNYRYLDTQSKLLHDDSNSHELELVLDRFRYHRQEAYSRHAVYIPPMSKPSLQASDETLNPLHGRVHQFLGGNGLVMLILGDSGAGKSTFSSRLEQELWAAYRAGDPIPLLIDLKVIKDPDQNLIQQHLCSLNIFSASHLKNLSSREFIMICDGYDESQSQSNLYNRNNLNKPSQWKAKMVISCRTQYLTPEYRVYFAPRQDAVAHLSLSPTEIYTEAVIIPFKLDQIKDYIAQYTSTPEASVNRPRWTTEQYLVRLQRLAHIMDLIKNPFMLRMILEILPTMSMATAQITRVELYDKFVDLHYENELNRLIEQQGKMDSHRHSAFKDMEELGFIELGIDYSKRLADAIFTEGKGVNSIEYSGIPDKKSWKQDFFGSDAKIQLLREASQLVRRTSAPGSQAQIKRRMKSAANRNMFRFSHLSILEYFYALSIYDPREDLPQIDPPGLPYLTASAPSLADHPLARRSLVAEPAIIQFLADRVRHSADFKNHLHALVQLSRSDITDTSVSCAASNAITILIRGGERFNGTDLRGIRVPGADLSCGDFDSAQLQGADLRDTILQNVWLHQADLSGSQMAGATFGQYPHLKFEGWVRHCIFSPDGRHLTAALSDGTIAIFNTSTWSKVYFPRHTVGVANVADTLSGNQIATESDDDTAILSDTATGVLGSYSSTSVAYSPNGHLIASGCKDNTVQLWDLKTGALVSSLSGHTKSITSVAYSPNGHQIASGGWDNTVRLWDVQTGAVISSLGGHTDWVTSVAYSPSGHQIASGSCDFTVRIWDAQTGTLVSSLSGHTDEVYSVAYSPSGHQIVSGSDDMTVRLWDAQTGAVISSLSGHSARVTSVAYSPSGHQIASGSHDTTVRLWDAQTGALISSMSGHTDWVYSVVYSPSGHQIASGSHDNTMRIWDAQTGAQASTSTGHTKSVNSVAYSPSGHQIVSGSWDNTVRLWDAQTGALVSSLSDHTNGVTSLAYSPSGHQIVTSSGDNIVRLWDPHTGALVSSMSGHTETVTSVAYSPSGHQIASGSWDNTVRLWDAQTGAAISFLSGHTHRVTSVVYSPSGHQIVSGSEDNTVRLWDAQTGTLASSLIGHTNTITSVAYSPSGHQIASGSNDTTIQLWDAQTGTLVSSLSGHTDRVTSVAYSPSGHQIASGSGDETVRLWDIYSGQCLVVLGGFQDITYGIAWKATIEGIYLAIGGRNKSLRMWKVTEDENEVRLCLHWRSTQDTLVLSKASIKGVQDLSDMNGRLFRQQGGLGWQDNL